MKQRYGIWREGYNGIKNSIRCSHKERMGKYYSIIDSVFTVMGFF